MVKESNVESTVRFVHFSESVRFKIELIKLSNIDVSSVFFSMKGYTSFNFFIKELFLVESVLSSEAELWDGNDFFYWRFNFFGFLLNS